MTDDAILLEAVDPDEELVDHPDEVTDDEAAAGLALYQAVDDLDDLDNGLGGPNPFHGAVGITGPSGFSLALTRARALREVLLDYGVPEVSIELVPGRPSSGDDWNSLNPVAVLSHHIASHPTASNPVPGLSLVKRGRSDLPGPLCNGTAGVDLVYRIICLGYANHSGSGGTWTVSGPLGRFTIPRDNGRGLLWGTEYEGGYTDEVWEREYTNARTKKRMTFHEFMGRANAGLVEGIWLPGMNSPGNYADIVRGGMDLSGYHGEHKTWAPGRKPDRRNIDTEAGRAQIRRYTIKEDPLPTPADVWNHPITVSDGDTKTENPEVPAGKVLAQAHRRAGDARSVARAAGKDAARAVRLAEGNRDAVRALSKGLDQTVQDAVEAALAAADSPEEPTS